MRPIASWKLAVALIAVQAGTVAPALAAERVGVAAAVRGAVTAMSPGASSRTLISGAPVFRGEIVRAGGDGGAQLLLNDETVFTLGPDAEVVLDEAVYDPQSGAGRVGVSLVKGALRFVTGKAAQARPESMRIALPIGTIGVRGTMGVLFAGDAARAPALGAPAGADPRVVVMLLGPGVDGEGTDRTGAIDVAFGGRTETLRRGGYAVAIGSSLVPAFRVPAGALAELLAPSPSATGRPASLGTASAPAGVTDGEARRLQLGQRELQRVLGTSQDSATLVQVSSTGAPGAATFADLVGLGFSGVVNHNQTAVPLVLSGTAVGSYDFSGFVNFGTRNAGATFTAINVPSFGVLGGFLNVPGTSFGGGDSTPAQFTAAASVGPAIGVGTYSVLRGGDGIPGGLSRLELSRFGQTAVGSAIVPGLCPSGCP